MARMTFLAPTPRDLSAFGVRALSAYLRSRGHETRIVFLPGDMGRLRVDGSFAYTYPEAALTAATALCRDSRLVGLSVMTPYYDRAAQLTKAVRATGVPVIWGGIHATVRPEDALRHADLVCVGEGEEALDELLANLDDAVPGIAAISGLPSVPGILGPAGGTGKTRLMPDLNALPAADFSGVEHYVIGEDCVARPLDDTLLESYLHLMPGRDGRLLRTYRTMTDRGCPHGCAYCSVPAVREMFRDDPAPYHRQRSVGHVLDELETVLRRFSFVQAVQFFDDTFFAKPVQWFREFAPEYKRRIGLPFYAQGSPATIDDERLDILQDAGMVFVEMGIQTGSAKMREIFHRRDTDRMVLDAARRIADRKAHLLPPVYHIIIDAPWENEDDLLDTVRLLGRLPGPFGLAISSLVFFPGTALHARAVAEGLIHDESSEVYRRPFYVPPRQTYAGFLLYLLTFPHFPRSLLHWLMGEPRVAFARRHALSPLYKTVYAMGEAWRLIGKGGRALRAGDFRRIGLWLQRRFGGDNASDGRKA